MALNCCFRLEVPEEPFCRFWKRYWGNSGLGDFELKLGRLTSIDSRSFSEELGDELSRGRINPKTASTASKIDATGVIPVGGNIFPDGLYYTYLNLGNPPRPYFLDMDTGSALTWIQCDAPCTSCAKGAHPFYKPVKANIIPPKDSFCVEIQKNQIAKDCDSCHQCDYEIEYADHSSSVGVLARDELYLNVANGSLAQSKIVFGCAYDQQGLLLNTLGKTDGILGLSRAKISLPSQLASQGIIKNVIGHCLAADARGGGYMFLGDDFVPYWQMAWVPCLRPMIFSNNHEHSMSRNSYQTNIVKVRYGSRQIGLGNVRSAQGHLVFDTGSSYSYFTEQAYNDLVTIFNDISSESLVRDMSDTSLPICWRAKSPLRSIEDVRQFFKPLNLHFGSKWWIVSTKLQIPPEGYLVVNSKGNVCLGILNGREVHDGSTFILGDISLRGLLIVYDNVKDKIGWFDQIVQGHEGHVHVEMYPKLFSKSCK
ncbi:UNVERIFIED_CONTAM: Aspartyl protease APCB1 [Sesamum latifolium]|uniref:Aspartyl protease APCB1 n=1 Tax=Sesamum latifolium TaxID=2727402 RepID=A0AAW2Y929_9LAMI